MKKVDQKVCKLVREACEGKWNGVRRPARNTQVIAQDGHVEVRLHNYEIFERHPDGRISIWHRGWRTPSTRNRLNACLAGAGIDATVAISDYHMIAWLPEGALDLDMWRHHLQRQPILATARTRAKAQLNRGSFSKAPHKPLRWLITLLRLEGRHGLANRIEKERSITELYKLLEEV